MRKQCDHKPLARIGKKDALWSDTEVVLSGGLVEPTGFECANCKEDLYLDGSGVWVTEDAAPLKEVLMDLLNQSCARWDHEKQKYFYDHRHISAYRDAIGRALNEGLITEDQIER